MENVSIWIFYDVIQTCARPHVQIFHPAPPPSILLTYYYLKMILNVWNVNFSNERKPRSCFPGTNLFENKNKEWFRIINIDNKIRHSLTHTHQCYQLKLDISICFSAQCESPVLFLHNRFIQFATRKLIGQAHCQSRGVWHCSSPPARALTRSRCLGAPESAVMFPKGKSAVVPSDGQAREK